MLEKTQHHFLWKILALIAGKLCGLCGAEEFFHLGEATGKMLPFHGRYGPFPLPAALVPKSNESFFIISNPDPNQREPLTLKDHPNASREKIP